MTVLQNLFPFIFLLFTVVLVVMVSSRNLKVRCIKCKQFNGKRYSRCNNCENDLFQNSEMQQRFIFTRTTILLSFFVPPVAWYLYAYTRHGFPEKSKTLLTLAIISPLIMLYNLLGVFHAGNVFVEYVL